MDLRSIYNLNRFREIVGTLLKYGLEDLVARLNIPTMPLIPHTRTEYKELSTWVRIRLALQDLGPTFIKLGQNLSLRPDLLPEGLVLELTKLQDDVEAEPFEMQRKVIEKSLGRPLEEIFSLFDEKPLAAASLAQVHRAIRLDTGAVVAVKVQRPGTEEIIENDLDILGAVAPWLHERYPDLQVYNLPGIVDLTRRSTRRELDFRREARQMQIARNNMAEVDWALIPEPHLDLSTRRVLIMDYVQGKKLSEMTEKELDECRHLGREGLLVTLTQVLKHGFFHADPHPGNLLITKDMRIALLDWGMVGRLTPDDREEITDLVQAVVDGRSDQLVNTLLTIVRPSVQVDKREIERELLDILDVYTAIPLREVSLGQLLLDITGMLRQHRLRMPPNVFFMVKALVAAEKCGRTINPDLNVAGEAEPLIRDLVTGRYHPQAIWRRAKSFWSGLNYLHRRMPEQIGNLMQKLEHGEFTMRFRHENLNSLMDTVENAADRVTFGLIVGSLIIGSSMIITTGQGSKLLGYPALGMIGFLLSGILGLWLLYRILRHPRH